MKMIWVEYYNLPKNSRIGTYICLTPILILIPESYKNSYSYQIPTFLLKVNQSIIKYHIILTTLKKLSKLLLNYEIKKYL